MIENKKTNVALDNIFEELVDLLEAGKIGRAHV